MKYQFFALPIIIFSLAACKLNITNSADKSFSCPSDRSQMEFSGGAGTVSRPYLICDELDLAELDDKLTDPTLYAQYGDKQYQQIADINLKGETKAFLPLGMIDIGAFSRQLDFTNLFAIMALTPSSQPFNGGYDGKNKKIIGIKFQSSGISDFLGLFHSIGSSGEVKNLVFERPEFSVAQSIGVGAVAGNSRGRIKNISIFNGSFHIDQGGMLGGVVGILNEASEVSNCEVNGRFTSNYLTTLTGGDYLPHSGFMGGVFGVSISHSSHILFKDLLNNSSFAGGDWVGGIGGLALGDIELINGKNTGVISGAHTAAGIIPLLASAKLFTHSNSPRVSVTNALNTGDVSANGILSADTAAAGLFVYVSDLDLNGGFNSGNVFNNHTIQGDSAGLIVRSVNDNTLNKVASIGNVSTRAGQIKQNGDPADTYFDVAGLIGGIDGGGSLSITNCFVMGELKAQPGVNDIGAIIADIWELDATVTIDKCFVAATFSGGWSGSGAVIGSLDILDTPSAQVNLNVSNTYWDQTLASDRFTDPRTSNGDFQTDILDVISASGGSYQLNAVSLPSPDMQLPSTYTGFDFATVWRMPAGGGYPVFR